MAEALLGQDIEAVIAKVVAKAKRGDMQAAKLVLDRVLAPRRGRPVRFPLPPVRTTCDVLIALQSLTKAVSAGQLTTEEAVAVADLVELQRQAIKTVEHESRLAAIEERMGLKNEQ
jgi:hypothetical protein